MKLVSQVLITQDFEETIRRLRSLAEGSVEFYLFYKEGNFLVRDAEEAIERAYLASPRKGVLILASEQFSDVVQNKLLKVIEEPPADKEFILLTRSKATILPTIRSRLPIVTLDQEQERDELDLDLEALDVGAAYEWIQKHRRIDSKGARKLAERVLVEAMRCGAYDLDARTLELFSQAVQVLERGSPGSFVLTTLLLKLLARRRRKN